MCLLDSLLALPYPNSFREYDKAFTFSIWRWNFLSRLKRPCKGAVIKTRIQAWVPDEDGLGNSSAPTGASCNLFALFSTALRKWFSFHNRTRKLGADWCGRWRDRRSATKFPFTSKQKMHKKYETADLSECRGRKTYSEKVKSGLISRKMERAFWKAGVGLSTEQTVQIRKIGDPQQKLPIDQEERWNPGTNLAKWTSRTVEMMIVWKRLNFEDDPKHFAGLEGPWPHARPHGQKKIRNSSQLELQEKAEILIACIAFNLIDSVLPSSLFMFPRTHVLSCTAWFFSSRDGGSPIAAWWSMEFNRIMNACCFRTKSAWPISKSMFQICSKAVARDK